MDFDQDPEIFGEEAPEKGPQSTHCNVPLKFSNQRAALNRPAYGQKIGKNNYMKKEFQAICRHAGDHFINHLEPSSQHCLLLSGLEIPTKALVLAEFHQQQQVSEELWKLNFDALSKVRKLEINPTFDLTPGEWTKLTRSYHIRCFWEEGVLSSGSDHFVPSLWWTKTPDGISIATIGTSRFYVSKNLFLIQSEYGSTLLSRDHLVMYSDLASQRHILRRIAILQTHTKNPSFLSPDYLEELLENGDHILHYGGNNSYKLIYGLEPLCLSHLIGEIPVGGIDSPSFAETINDDLLKLAKEFRVERLHLQRSELIRDKADNPNMISQIFGLYRIWGHPTVEPLGGASALKKVVTKVRILNQERAMEISDKFKEEFIMRYIQKHNHWPELDCSELSLSNVIRKSYEIQGVYPKGRRDYKRAHLRLVKFNQCFPVDPKFDLVEMISDKALSLLTPDLKEHIRFGKGAGTSVERSVLVSWLESSLHDPVKFLKFIDKYGFPQDERSVGFKEKEREGKVDARMFGLITIIKRMYIVLTEAMLSEHIMVYFPEITMVDDEITLEKKRYSFASKRSTIRSLYTSLDFAKWNSNMREEETRPIFQDFDHLFGFQSVYIRTHEMFNTSFMYLLNGSYLPTLRGGEFVTDIGSWRGHLGGIEGLRQKGWTIWTVILILTASENHSIQLQLMGQGDNQILREMFPVDMSDEEALYHHFEFIKSLDNLLSVVGPPLKVEETWSSWDLFIYGKYLIYRGAPLTTYAKRLCRLFRLANEDFPTLESSLSSLTANLSAAMSCNFIPGELYYVYCLELTGLFQLFFRSSYLQRRAPDQILIHQSTLSIPHASGRRLINLPPLLSSNLLQRNHLYIKLALLPRALGGFPINTLLLSLLRGFPDEVSLAISSLKLIHSVATGPIQSYIAQILDPPLASDTNYKMLFEHPTALNLLIPPAPSEARRNLVVSYLQTTPRVKNPYFKTFIELLQSGVEDTLVEFLSTVEPFNPRLLGQVNGATVEARATHLAGRLQATKMISMLAREEGFKDIYSVVAQAEFTHLQSVLRLILHPGTHNRVWTPSSCSLTHAQHLRDQGWKKHVVGVDCVPPFEFMVMEDLSPHSRCNPEWDLQKGYISIKLSSSLTSEESADPLVMGSFQPYRGSVTRQRTTGFGDKIAVQADPLISKTLRLFSLIGWAVPREGNLSQVIYQLLAARTDLDPNLLTPDSDQISGSIHHRLQDERTGHGGSVTILPNFGSQFVFDTFPLTEYSKGSKNVNLMFQPIMSLATVLLSWDLGTRTKAPPRTVHIHVKSACCVRPVIDTFMDSPITPRVGVLVNKENPYLFISAQTLLQGQQQITSFPAEAPPALSPGAAQQRLISMMAQEIYTAINPGLWNMPSRLFIPRSLLINWALRLPLLPTLETLVLFLAAFFLPSLRHDSPKEFLLRLHERISKSSLTFWSQLQNLIFAPNFHHELVKMPYKTSISGNPCLTPLTLGYNLRGAVANIALTWSTNLQARTQLISQTIETSPFCGLTMHPSLLLLTRDYLLGIRKSGVLTIRQKILKLIKDGSDSENETPALVEARKYVRTGRRLISNDSLDTLCKKAPDLPLAAAERQVPPLDLPSAVYKIGVWNSRDLVHGTTEIRTHDPTYQHRYRSHEDRPVASPTSGQYKGMAQLNEKSKESPERVICIGDGSGGFTFSALRMYPTAQVMYNTLASPDGSIQQAPTIPYLPALASWPDLESRLMPLTLVNEDISDITHPDFPETIRQKGAKTFDIIMCDAECPNYLEGVKPIELAQAVCTLGETLKARRIIFKTYALSPLILRQQVSIFLCKYRQVTVFRNAFSSDGNTEVYLEIEGLEGGQSIMVTAQSVIGPQLPSEFERRIKMILLESLLGYPSIPPMTIVKYSEAIEPNLDMLLFRQLSQGLPFIFQDDPIIYPHSITKWIGQTTMKRPGEPSLSRRSMETTVFRRPYLVRWVIGHLTVWSSLSQDHPNTVDELWSQICIIWFRLSNGSWDISMYSGEDLPEGESPDRVIWKISSFMTSMHLKVIHRLRGVMNIVGIRVVSRTEGMVTGGLDADGRPKRPGFHAVDRWCRTVLQRIPASAFSIPPRRDRILSIPERVASNFNSYRRRR